MRLLHNPQSRSNPMSAKRKDPKEMSNRQRVARIEFLEKRRAKDKAEMATLTEHVMADLNSSRT
jgi:hypothetical protein